MHPTYQPIYNQAQLVFEDYWNFTLENKAEIDYSLSSYDPYLLFLNSSYNSIFNKGSIFNPELL